MLDDNLNLDANNKAVKVRMKNTTSDAWGRLFFITSADQGWDAAKSKALYIEPNSDYTEYTLDMSDVAGWGGNLLQLRFDPPGSSGSFSIDYIQVGTYIPPSVSQLVNTTFTYKPRPPSSLRSTPRIENSEVFPFWNRICQ